MFGVIFAIFISVILPITAFVYAVLTKRWFPFVFGILAFTISQLMIRIPLLDYLQTNSTKFILLSTSQPILYSLILGLSAGVFEEVARYLFMRFLMKDKDWTSGFVFGLGHGGIEALLLVGIGAISILFSPLVSLYGAEYFIGGAERFFAISLHVALSIIVLRSVVEKRLIYLFIAILIHGLGNSLIGIIPLYLQGKTALFLLEFMIAFIAFATFTYSLIIKRKGILS